MHTEGDPEQRWRKWVSFETRKRLGIAICLLDTIFPALLDSPAYLSHGDMLHLAMPCDSWYWEAATARTWTSMLGFANTPATPLFIKW